MADGPTTQVSLTRRQIHLICGALNAEAAKYEHLVGEQMVGDPVAHVPADTVEVWHIHSELLRALSRNILAVRPAELAES